MNRYFDLWWQACGADVTQGVPDGGPSEAVRRACQAAWEDAKGVAAGQLLLRLRKVLKSCKDRNVGADGTRREIVEELIKFLSE